MQHQALESREETPVGVSFALVSSVFVLALALAPIGLISLLIRPGCGMPA